MKKIILFCLLLGSAILYSTNKDFPQTSGEKTSVRPARETSNNPEVKAAIVKKDTIDEALSEVRTTELFEASFNNLTIDEVHSRLASTEKILNQSNLFHIANSEQGLDTSAAKQLVELMRIKQALNKILLNRQLEEMHRKYL